MHSRKRGIYFKINILLFLGNWLVLSDLCFECIHSGMWISFLAITHASQPKATAGYPIKCNLEAKNPLR